MSTLSPTSATEFRRVLGRFASGLTVITSIDDAGPVGFTCQSFSSLSLDPPLVLFCVADTSTSWARIAPTGRFAVNILAADQQDVCRALAAPGSRDKFRRVAWNESSFGTAHLAGSLVTIDCRISGVYPGGDHHIVVGEAQGLHDYRDGAPLLFFGGHFCSASVHTGPAAAQGGTQ
ncbi:flavin reductase family protein [Hoyosella altamirensis]|uniref:3-hydroxy-9,10-secoandrosta-1,3,5(10)-triene-9, 17-dione monooxygenase reductase component n=1 Tax=Hoyosella altamirensis TaxID=616997 RepID=A0A839RSN6_9ACTN|nr:flavin reductase family protein [Hoyosella altamirensis]MBB3039228.1 3-hydroxy-9,10-secoandrosta-1,3,5(10)-triene-9,17-dione monooxygenase reductase component [Hoyosella altamirensis]